MNTLNDLRASLNRHADLAPDGFGLVEQAQRGAARIRRRRIVGVGAAVAAVLVVTAVVPTLVQSRRPGPQLAAPSEARTSTTFTLGVAAGSGITLTDLRSDDSTQSATAVDDVLLTGADLTLLQVTVYDPDAIDDGVFQPGDRPSWERAGQGPRAFDSSMLRRGTPTTVGARPAWLNADYVQYSDTSRTQYTVSRLLGWQDPSGAWVTVNFDSGHRKGCCPITAETKTRMLTIAEALRIGPVRDIPGPYQLGWLPSGIQVRSVYTDAVAKITEITLSRATSSTPGSEEPLPVIIYTAPITRDLSAARNANATTKGTIAGHLASYDPGSRSMDSPVEVDYGNCFFSFRVGSDAISFADLEHIVAAMKVVDCTAPASWILRLQR